MYKVKAEFDFDTMPGAAEISIREGEVLTVIRESIEGGWLEGKNAKDQVGLFPESYVKKIASNTITGMSSNKPKESASHSSNLKQYDYLVAAERHLQNTERVNTLKRKLREIKDELEDAKIDQELSEAEVKRCKRILDEEINKRITADVLTDVCLFMDRNTVEMCQMVSWWWNKVIKERKSILPLWEVELARFDPEENKLVAEIVYDLPKKPWTKKTRKISLKNPHPILKDAYFLMFEVYSIHPAYVLDKFYKIQQKLGEPMRIQIFDFDPHRTQKYTKIGKDPEITLDVFDLLSGGIQEFPRICEMAKLEEVRINFSESWKDFSTMLLNVSNLKELSPQFPKTVSFFFTEIAMDDDDDDDYGPHQDMDSSDEEASLRENNQMRRGLLNFIDKNKGLFTDRNLEFEMKVVQVPQDFHKHLYKFLPKIVPMERSSIKLTFTYLYHSQKFPSKEIDTAFKSMKDVKLTEFPRDKFYDYTRCQYEVTKGCLKLTCTVDNDKVKPKKSKDTCQEISYEIVNI